MEKALIEIREKEEEREREKKTELIEACESDDCCVFFSLQRLEVGWLQVITNKTQFHWLTLNHLNNIKIYLIYSCELTALKMRKFQFIFFCIIFEFDEVKNDIERNKKVFGPIFFSHWFIANFLFIVCIWHGYSFHLHLYILSKP